MTSPPQVARGTSAAALYRDLDHWHGDHGGRGGGPGNRAASRCSMHRSAVAPKRRTPARCRLSYPARPTDLGRARAAIESFANHVLYIGDQPGQAQIAKLINNLLSSAGKVVAFEGMAMAMKAGIDLMLLDQFHQCQHRPQHGDHGRFPDAAAATVPLARQRNRSAPRILNSSYRGSEPAWRTGLDGAQRTGPA